MRIADLFEGVIDVFDLVTGTFLASHDIGGGMLSFLRPGVLYELREGPDGEASYQLWNVRLAR
jgi:hypothetical protein